MASPRSYAEQGCKDVLSTLISQNSFTHSHTVQYHISKAGLMGKKLLIVFQELKGSFGVRIQEEMNFCMQVFPQVVVLASQSGKMGKKHVEEWFDRVFKPELEENSSILLLDAFGGQGPNRLLSERTDKTLHCQYIPKGTTYLCQPCDLGLFRQLKAIIRPIVVMCRSRFLGKRSGLKTSNRYFIIVSQVLAHNQLSADCYVPMLKHAWQAGGYKNSSPVDVFKAVNEVNFLKLSSLKCESCDSFCFIRCAHCSKTLCFDHFVLNFHYHEVANHNKINHQNLPKIIDKLAIPPGQEQDDEE